MKRAEELVLFAGLALLLAGCGPSVDKVVPDWEDVFFNATDCLHPNGTGKERIAELSTEKLEEMVSAF